MVFITNKIKKDMRNTITIFKKTIKTELIKKKRSAIFTLSIIFGALIPTIGFIVDSLEYLKEKDVETSIPSNFYFDFLENALIPFTNFFFPVLIIFCASKIAQIDHKNKGWHLMETLPTTKFSVYFSKFILLMVSNLIAITTLLTTVILFCFLQSLFFDIPSDKVLTIPFLLFLKVGARLFVISLCISAFQYAFSVIVSNFIWPIILGFMCMILPLILSEANIILTWYPYKMLSQIATHPNGSDFGYFFTFSDILSIVYSTLFFYIGFNWYRFKSFYTSFLKSKIRLIKIILLLIVFSFIIANILEPKHQNTKENTIITGVVESNTSIKKLYIFNIITKDTIANITINSDNTFKHKLEDNIVADNYLFQFSNGPILQIYFGAKDSIHLNYKHFGRNPSDLYFKISGTRLAENIQNNEIRFPFSFINHNLNNNRKIDDASYYMDKIHEEWQNSLSKLNTIRTVDNLAPRKDYMNRMHKIMSLKFLKNWNTFQEKREVLFPDKKYKKTKGIIDLEESLSFTDESLLSNQSYLDYVLKKLIKNDAREVSQSTKYFTAIDSLEPGIFKDILMFTQLEKSMANTTLNSVRDSLMKNYISSIDKKSYKKLLKKTNSNLNRLSKGEIAPNFIAFDSNGNKFNLDDFKGKYLFIDV